MTLKIINDRTSLEKLLRYALVVAPNEFGLVPGEGCYVGMKELLAAVRDEEGFRGTSESRIMELCNIPMGKSCFETEGGLIRLKPELSSLPPEIPEDFRLLKELFVGHKPSAWPHLHKTGLSPKRPKEDNVLLFTDKDFALKVAKRFCPDPVSLRILVGKAAAAGVVFTPCAANLVLCPFVPPAHILGPAIKQTEEPEPAKAPAREARDFAPATLVAEIPHGKKKGKYSDEPDWKVRTRKDRRDRKD